MQPWQSVDEGEKVTADEQQPGSAPPQRTIPWRVATVGAAVAGLAIGGFSLAVDDSRAIESIDLRTPGPRPGAQLQSDPPSPGDGFTETVSVDSVGSTDVDAGRGASGAVGATDDDRPSSPAEELPAAVVPAPSDNLDSLDSPASPESVEVDSPDSVDS